ASADVRDRPVTVPLDLELPLVAAGHPLPARERREHRRVVALPGRRRPLLPLPEDQPVLRVAVQVRGDQRPGAFEPLAVQPYCQAAVALPLDELVGAVVPDLDGARPVLADRDLALEARVVERVVLDVHGERALPGLERDALRNRPAKQDAVLLEPEV